MCGIIQKGQICFKIFDVPAGAGWSRDRFCLFACRKNEKYLSGLIFNTNENTAHLIFFTRLQVILFIAKFIVQVKIFNSSLINIH